MAARDDSALGDVYDQYSSFVYGLAVRVIGDTRAAEDVSRAACSAPALAML